jgi:glycosyltransferase involved in cell wall biosynthesis
VVVGDDSGCGEVVGALEGGRVVPTGDVGALAAALAAILAAPEAWRRAAARGGAEARVRFAPDTVCATLDAIYHDVAVRRPCPAHATETV